ncbi:MAG: hydroxyethylthiazole kinase [Actinobacteria bacterium]|nr:hydroxyethylthiazole kinase [Actinomycetota bacterium]
MCLNRSVPGAASTAEHLSAIREARPLIHNITNFVVMNETANAILALGALPVMAHAPEEVEEFARMAGAVVLNIGTLWPDLVDSMVLAGRAANEVGVPVVLDPVGAGATALRNDATRRILGEVDVALVRGNAAEVAFLAGESAEIRGVESMGIGGEIAAVAQAFARQQGCAVAVTGAVDYVADAERIFTVANGHPLMGRITGSGCMSSTMCASFLAVASDHAAAAAEALAAFGVAGEVAAARSEGPGSFHAALYDALDALDAVALTGVRIEAV